MNRFFLASFILLFVRPAAAAERDCAALPSKTREQKITKNVCEGLEFRDAYREALTIETAAREALQAEIPDEQIRKKTLEEWALATEALKPAMDGMSARFRDAVNDTLDLYGVAPTRGDGDINDGPVRGGRALWMPAYRFRMSHDQPLLREMELPAQPGRPASKAHIKWRQSQVEEGKAFAMTWADGRVDIMDEAFESVLQKNSPRVLGYLLHHESVHFDQLRNGQWKTLNEREIDAYKASIAAAPRFGLTADEIKGLNKMLGYNRMKVWRQDLGWGDKPRELPPPEMEADNSKEWGRLEKAIRITIPAERERLREQLDLERNGRNAPTPNASDDQTQEELERSLREIVDSDSKSPEEALRLLDIVVERICSVGRSGLVTDDRALAVWERWRSEFYTSVPPIPHWRDASPIAESYSCPEFIVNQIGIARKDGQPANGLDFYWLNHCLVVRQAALDRVSPPGLRPAQPSSPQPVPQSPPTVEPAPPAYFPDPGEGSTPTPAIPHCRYHPWCKG